MKKIIKGYITLLFNTNNKKQIRKTFLYILIIKKNNKIKNKK